MLHTYPAVGLRAIILLTSPQKLHGTQADLGLLTGVLHSMGLYWQLLIEYLVENQHNVVDSIHDKLLSRAEMSTPRSSPS